MNLNERAWKLADEMEARADELRLGVRHVAGARVIDATAGGLAAGLMLSRVCMADLGIVRLEAGPTVTVQTDHALQACLASQYAGWQVQTAKYFAMGSGPMRALANRENVIQNLQLRETSDCAVGVLETGKLPTEEVVASIIAKLPADVAKLTLIFASTKCLAGTVQVVARSVETALHKLHELDFDVFNIFSGHGTAPLPPVAKDDITGIGRTNDAILYGAQVTLWVDAEQEVIDAIGPKVPSNSSKEHGALFGELFQRYNGDFYKIDPHLFSPAVVTFINQRTGVSQTFGAVEPELLRKSFT
jgi:methenyltetrahydromethanopterin cyclohydrolase